MNSSSPPPAPDPVKTAQAQTASNKETAIANANLNRVDQTTPFGTSTYQIVGTNPDGTPKYTQSTAFSAPVQGLFDANMSMSQGLADTGVNQINGIKAGYSTPFDLNAAAKDNITALQRERLDPILAQREEALRNRLTNQGIREGSEAWDRALLRNDQSSNDAYNSLIINGDQWATQKALQARNQPINEFNSIRTGTQVNLPTFAQTPGVNMANTDVAGITQAGYQNQMAAYNAQQAQDNAFMGGLFGLGGTLGAAGLKALPGLMAFSDIRLKRDIKRIGSLPSGLPVYTYRYLDSDTKQIGVMAHEARELFPDAVAEFGGFLAVDYSRIG